MGKENKNNKVYFIVSDIHSFYDELVEALSVAGYDKDNPEHTLIVDGDIFDRGPKSAEVYEFLRSLPRERRILIKGNHEQLFIELANKEMPEPHDYSNKTVLAYCQLTDSSYTPFEVFLYMRDDIDIKAYWEQIREDIKDLGIVEWLMSDEWVNYYEVERFIFVHSFIPAFITNKTPGRLSGSYTYQYNPDWRTDSTKDEWDASWWGCPWRHYMDGLFKQEEAKGKTLVCGHWHTGDFHKHLGNNFDSFNTDIFYSKGIIAIDGGVFYKENTLYHPCNVLVIDNNKCYNKYGDELVNSIKIDGGFAGIIEDN